MRHALFVTMVVLAIISFPTAAGDSEANECKLALLDHNLASVDALLDIRKSLLDQSPDTPKIKDFIDYKVDPTLLLDISEITLKDAFATEYRDPTAQKLYKKNAEGIMREFCRYKPKNLKALQNVVNPIVNDCKQYGCNYCDLGL